MYSPNGLVFSRFSFNNFITLSHLTGALFLLLKSPRLAMLGSALLLSLLFLAQNSIAQEHRLEVIANAGQEYNTGQVVVNWTVGEPVISTMGNRTHFFTTGFNQTYWEIVAVWNPVPLDLSISVYPNPMSTDLYLRFDDFETYQEQYQFIVYDMLYKPVFTATLEEEESAFDLSFLENGTYLIHVANEGGEFLKSFKVIKNQ